VALESEEGVVAEHAAAVVADTDETASAILDLDAEVGGAGVEGVFEELFDGGRGTFDYFTGSDLVGNDVGEDANATHGEWRAWALSLL